MHKLLSICPSRGRPKQMAVMIDSWLATKSEGSKMVVYLNYDDIKLDQYDIKHPDIKVTTGKRRFLSEVVNYNWGIYQDQYDYFQVINDDHVYLTPQWDVKLIDIIQTRGKGWGIACPNDLMTNWAVWKHPSAEVISANIPRALGYYIWPRIRHIGTDTVLGRLGMGIDRMWREEKIIIEHRHWTNGKSVLDDNYKWVYGTDEQQYGNNMVGEYIIQHLQEDIDKVKSAMAKEGV